MSKAHETPAGQLVRYQDKLWLKAERPSRDYLNHYLVEASAKVDLALVYIDPDTDLALIAASANLSELSPRPTSEPAQPGDVLANRAGQHFIKAQDIKKDGQRHLAYVDIASGEIRPRQERDLTAIYSAWKLIAG